MDFIDDIDKIDGDQHFEKIMRISHLYDHAPIDRSPIIDVINFFLMRCGL